MASIRRLAFYVLFGPLRQVKGDSSFELRVVSSRFSLIGVAAAAAALADDENSRTDEAVASACASHFVPWHRSIGYMQQRHEPSIIFWHFPIWHFTHAEIRRRQYTFLSFFLFCTFPKGRGELMAALAGSAALHASLVFSRFIFCFFFFSSWFFFCCVLCYCWQENCCIPFTRVELLAVFLSQNDPSHSMKFYKSPQLFFFSRSSWKWCEPTFFFVFLFFLIPGCILIAFTFPSSFTFFVVFFSRIWPKGLTQFSTWPPESVAAQYRFLCERRKWDPLENKWNVGVCVCVWVTNEQKKCDQGFTSHRVDNCRETSWNQLDLFGFAQNHCEAVATEIRISVWLLRPHPTKSTKTNDSLFYFFEHFNAILNRLLL